MDSPSIVKNILLRGLTSGSPVSFFMPLRTLSLINSINSVVICKVNKVRRLFWLSMVMNGRMIPTKSAATGGGNLMLRYRVRKI